MRGVAGEGIDRSEGCLTKFPSAQALGSHCQESVVNQTQFLLSLFTNFTDISDNSRPRKC